MYYIGKIDVNLLGKEFDDLQTDEVIITDERIVHIKKGHDMDFEFFKKYCNNILEEPDYVLKDHKNENTIFMIKHIEDTNMNIVIRLAVINDEKHPKNSILTAYRVRNKNVQKLVNKNKTLYKSE